MPKNHIFGELNSDYTEQLGSICLLEIKQSFVGLLSKLSFLLHQFNYYVIPSGGLSGGLALFWSKKLGTLEWRNVSDQAIHGFFTIDKNDVCFISFVYASTDYVSRRTCGGNSVW